MRRIRETRVGVDAPTRQEREWPSQGDWTYEDYARLPDDGWRYEVIRGVLHMAPAPKPKHQKAVGRLYNALSDFVEHQNLGDVYFSPIDVILSPGLATPVQPDMLFIARDRLDIVKEQFVEGAPDLIVEVLSPSNWLADRRDKREVYAEAGVREYWIVDPERRDIEIFVLDNGEYALAGKFGAGEDAASQILGGFEVAVAEAVPE